MPDGYPRDPLQRDLATPRPTPSSARLPARFRGHHTQLRSVIEYGVHESPRRAPQARSSVWRPPNTRVSIVSAEHTCPPNPADGVPRTPLMVSPDPPAGVTKTIGPAAHRIK